MQHTGWGLECIPHCSCSAPLCLPLPLRRLMSLSERSEREEEEREGRRGGGVVSVMVPAALVPCRLCCCACVGVCRHVLRVTFACLSCWCVCACGACWGPQATTCSRARRGKRRAGRWPRRWPRARRSSSWTFPVSGGRVGAEACV